MTDVKPASPYWLALQSMLRDPAGRLVLREILFRVAQVDEAAFQPGLDGLTLAWGDGRRSVGRDLKRHLQVVDQRAYAALVAEEAVEPAA